MLPAELDLREAARRSAPVLGAYARELAAPAIATWHRRMVNEYASSEVFEALSCQLAAAGFDAELARECAGFAAEERRHGVLCGAVVEALGGRAQTRIPARDPYPQHRDATPHAAVLRNVIHICCMSETVAVALIGAERLEMPEGELRELLTRIWADEVGHARFGWRLLERFADQLSAEDRAAIDRYLPTALSHLEAHELAHIPDCDAPHGGEALGLCSGRDGRRLLYETLSQVIRPGLRRWFSC